MLRQKKHFIFALCGLCLALFTTAGLVYFARAPKKTPAPPVVSQRVSPINLILRTDYQRCGHFTVEKKLLTNGNISDIGRYYSGWQIGKENKEGLVLIHNNHRACPICETEEFLGILDGKVAVFCGRPEQRGPIKEVTVLEVKNLPLQERMDLEQGLIIKNGKEKLQIIEGLASLQDG